MSESSALPVVSTPTKSRQNILLVVLATMLFTALATGAIALSGATIYYQSLQRNAVPANSDTSNPATSSDNTPASPPTGSDNTPANPTATVFPDMSKVPAGWNLYVNSKLKYAFAYPADYNVYGVNLANSGVGQSTDSGVEVSKAYGLVCAALDITVYNQAVTGVPVTVDGGPEIRNTTETDATIGKYTGKLYSYAVGGNGFGKTLKAALDESHYVSAGYGSRCTAAGIETYGIVNQDAVTQQIITSFQYNESK